MDPAYPTINYKSITPYRRIVRMFMNITSLSRKKTVSSYNNVKEVSYNIVEGDGVVKKYHKDPSSANTVRIYG